MHLFFQIPSLQLLIFCVEDWQFIDNLDRVILFFFCNIIKNNHLCIFFILLHLISSSLHGTSPLVPHTYVSIESIDCILSSSFTLNAILLTSSVNTFCFSPLNLCCDFYEFFMIFSETFHIDFSCWFILFSN